MDPTDWIDLGGNLLPRRAKRLISLLLTVIMAVSAPTIVRFVDWYAAHKAATITRQIEKVFPSISPTSPPQPSKGEGRKPRALSS